jgi:hypothetical protein
MRSPFARHDRLLRIPQTCDPAIMMKYSTLLSVNNIKVEIGEILPTLIETGVEFGLGRGTITMYRCVQKSKSSPSSGCGARPNLACRTHNDLYIVL